MSERIDGIDLDNIVKVAEAYTKELSKIIEVLDNPTLDITAKSIASSLAESKLYEQFAHLTNKSIKDIQKDIINYRARLTSVKQTGEEDVINLRDFLSSSHQDDIGDWLVLNTIPLGALMYIGAGPKVGKTDLMYNLMRAVSTGTDWLGNPVNQGDIVLFSLEESRNSIKTKARDHGYYASMFMDSCPANIHLVKDLDLANNPVKVRDVIKDYKPKLVVIDTLRAALKCSPYDDNQQMRWEPLRTVQSYALQYNVTILALHHFNKLDNHNESLTKLLSGHSVLPSIGEGAIGLFRDKTGNTILKFETRDTGTKKLLLKRKRDKLTRQITIEVAEILGLPPEVLALRKRIIFLLMYKPCTYLELEDLLGSNCLDAALESLEDDCTITSKYKEDDNIAEFYITKSVKYYLSKSPAYKDVSVCAEIANRLLSCDNKEEVLEVYKLHGIEIVNKTMGLLPSAIANEFRIKLGMSIEDPSKYLVDFPGSTIVKVDLFKDKPPVWHIKLIDGTIIKSNG